MKRKLLIAGLVVYSLLVTFYSFWRANNDVTEIFELQDIGVELLEEIDSLKRDLYAKDFDLERLQVGKDSALYYLHKCKTGER